MDVSCERCKTEYELDDSSVSEGGTDVQCSTCGHTFLVVRSSRSLPAAPPVVSTDDAGLQAAEWLIETGDGQTHRFRNLTSLQTWIVERKVTRNDRISRTGQAWRRLGEIVELTPFFDVVDEADRARATAMAVREGSSSELPVEHPGRPGAPRTVGPPSLELAPVPDLERPGWLQPVPRARWYAGAAKAMVGVVVTGVVAYLGIAQPWRQPPRSPESARAPAAASPPATAAPHAPAPAPPASFSQPAPEPAALPPDPASPVAPLGFADVAVPPASYERLVAEADKLLENGWNDRAQRLYDRALKLRSSGQEALAGLGYIALDRGNANYARALFKRALAQNPGYGPAIFGLGEALRAAGDLDLALDQYRRYLAAEPAGVDAHAASRQMRAIEALRRAAKVPATETAESAVQPPARAAPLVPPATMPVPVAPPPQP